MNIKPMLGLILSLFISGLILFPFAPASAGSEEMARANELSRQLSVLYNQGEYEKAIPIAKEILSIFEKELGPDQPEISFILMSLAKMHEEAGHLKRAAPLYQRALAINEKILGPEHALVVMDLNNLAMLYQALGNYAKAEPLYRRSHDLRAKVLGPDHPGAAESLNNLAGLYAAMNCFEQAHRTFMKAWEIDAKLIDQVLGFTSEDKAMGFLRTRRAQLEAMLSLVLLYLGNNDRIGKKAYNVWLKRKGVVLETQRKFQEALVRTDDPEATGVFQALAGVRSRLSRLIFRGPGKGGPEAYRTEIARVEAMEQELEAKMSRLSQAFARQKRVNQAEAEQVARALPEGSVLVDFAQIRLHDFQAKGQEKKWSPPHYLAFVLRAGNGEQVVLLDLGETKPIDNAVDQLKKNMPDPRRAGKTRAAARQIHDLVFAPIKEKLGESQKIFISPRRGI